MRNLWLSCLFLWFQSAGVWAQVITVSGEIVLKTEYLYDVLGKVGDFTLVVKDGVDQFDIHAFDQNMATAWTSEHELDSRKSRIINIVPHEDNFDVIYSDERKDSLVIQVRNYSPTVQLNYTDTLLMIKRGLIKPRYRFTRSEDKNIFLMTEVENERILSAFAYDLVHREILWFAELEFGNVDFREEYRKTIITNDGTMYVIFERNNVKHKIHEHTLDIFRFDRHLKTFTQTAIPLTEFITYDAFYKFDNLNGRLLTLGLYTEKNSGDTDGLYHAILNANNLTEYTVRKINYDEELIADFHGKYNPKNESLYNLDIQDVILRQDGGVLLLAEENKEYERLTYGGRRDYYGSRYSVDYYYEDLILISLHGDGSGHWQKLLPKRQYSNDDEAAYSSYFLFKNPSYLRILYNDEIRSDNTVSEYILNGAGDITRRSLMSTDNQRLRLQIKNAVQVSANELVIPSVRGKRLRLVRLRY